MHRKKTTSYFYSDLQLSRTKEKELANYLVTEHKAKTELAPDTYFTDWDVSTTATTNSVVTYEVKVLRGTSRNGHDTSRKIYVELNHIIDGKIKPAGLSSSKANYYAFCLLDDIYWYILPSAKLKQLVDEQEYEYTYLDKNGYTLAVFDRSFLMQHFIQI
jgi:hypothetical protein